MLRPRDFYMSYEGQRCFISILLHSECIVYSAFLRVLVVPVHCYGTANQFQNFWAEGLISMRSMRAGFLHASDTVICLFFLGGGGGGGGPIKVV